MSENKQLDALENDQELAVVKNNTLQLGDYANALVIKTDEDNRTAINMLANVKDMARQAETKRKLIVDPYNGLIKSINNYFRPLTDTLANCESAIKRKIMAYQQEIADKAEKARMATMKKIEEGKITLEQGVKKLEKVAEPEKTVRSAEATMTFREVKKVEITDASKLPREYLIPDEAKIKKVALAGVQIPGVQVVIEKVPSIRNNF